MEWNDIAQTLFYGGWTIIGIWVATSINKMRDSVETLNINVAVIVSKVEGHEQRIENLERKT